MEETISPSQEEATAALAAADPAAVPVVLSTRARFVVVERAMKLPNVPPQKDRPNPKLGVGACPIPTPV